MLHQGIDELTWRSDVLLRCETNTRLNRLQSTAQRIDCPKMPGRSDVLPEAVLFSKVNLEVPQLHSYLLLAAI